MRTHRSRTYGNFGARRTAYRAARKGFPLATIDFIFSALTCPHPLILDLGCGTGIATRQLADRGGIVFGADVDTLMIEAAIRQPSRNTGYCVSAAEKIAFPEQVFDAVTCFSAFHWFDVQPAIAEIKRVLQPNGLVAIINKHDGGELKVRFRALLVRHLQTELPDIKMDYDPLHYLQRHNFSNVRTHTSLACERFTVDEAVTYFQSTSLWNLVPAHRESDALRDLEEFCKLQSRNGYLIREVAVTTVLGHI